MQVDHALQVPPSHVRVSVPQLVQVCVEGPTQPVAESSGPSAEATSVVVTTSIKGGRPSVEASGVDASAGLPLEKSPRMVTQAENVTAKKARTST
jgi:hypothetical protein